MLDGGPAGARAPLVAKAVLRLLAGGPEDGFCGRGPGPLGATFPCPALDHVIPLPAARGRQCPTRAPVRLERRGYGGRHCPASGPQGMDAGWCGAWGSELRGCGSLAPSTRKLGHCLPPHLPSSTLLFLFARLCFFFSFLPPFFSFARFLYLFQRQRETKLHPLEPPPHPGGSSWG